MSAARIVNKGDKLDYELENYYFVDGRVFEVINDPFKSEVTVTKLERYELRRGKLCI